MKILFITSTHNSLSQRLLIELEERGHAVVLSLATSDAAMVDAVARHAPELIIAPMLKVAIPESAWSRHTCLIVHPGIKGDRGPCSLDWALAGGEARWGVTVLEAVAEMDAGPIWASQTFALANRVNKSRVYRNEVTEAAACAVLEAVTRFESRRFQPEPLDYSGPGALGRLRPAMRQCDRATDWASESTATIVRKIGAADSAPGLLDTLMGRPVYMYGAHIEERLRGRPGEILAVRHGAICRATHDGAVWVTHLKPKHDDDSPGIKLPAAQVLGRQVRDVPRSILPVAGALDYRTYRDIRYEERGEVGYLYFDFYNGAMSTEHCDRLRDAYRIARSRPTRVIVLAGGEDFFSNGIDLNAIEASVSPPRESWRNIVAIDDLVREILTTSSHVVVAALRGNAGAGGAMLALAADVVFARRGVVLNPHYKGMGGLYGSEYWTYCLPRRVGKERALELTEQLRPIGTRFAKDIGFLDDAFGETVEDFERELEVRVAALAGDQKFWRRLIDKHERRLADERIKPLGAYRDEELKKIRINFFGPDPSYHHARRRFVFKGKIPARVLAQVTLAPESTQAACA
jgi:putative two-component system hydrogenase maturation factor HypX/HoxX